MKLRTLMENTACNWDLKAEHGLSLYIETGDYKILFDAGQSAAFAENAEKLGIDLTQVDFAVLSHGHYDHGGGLKRFLEINRKAKVYVSAAAFGEHYDGTDRYVGLDQSLKEQERLIYVDEKQRLAEGITLLPGSSFGCVVPVQPFGLQVRRNGTFFPEDFVHEQYLLIEEKGKRILISGCSHRGILNIVRWIPCDVLIGGFHFMKLDPEGEALKAAAEQLLRYPVTYYTGHCTGTLQYDAMKKIMGNRLSYLSAGSTVEL